MACLNKEVEGALIVLGDQPEISADHLQSLIRHWKQNPEQIVATRYGVERNGVPALFGRRWFTALSTLNGDSGARTLIEQNRDQVIAVSCDYSLADIDTPDDYRALLNRSGY